MRFQLATLAILLLATTASASYTFNFQTIDLPSQPVPWDENVEFMLGYRIQCNTPSHVPPQTISLHFEVTHDESIARHTIQDVEVPAPNCATESTVAGHINVNATFSENATGLVPALLGVNGTATWDTPSLSDPQSNPWDIVFQITPEYHGLIAVLEPTPLPIAGPITVTNMGNADTIVSSNGAAIFDKTELAVLNDGSIILDKGETATVKLAPNSDWQGEYVLELQPKYFHKTTIRGETLTLQLAEPESGVLAPGPAIALLLAGLAFYARRQT